MRTISNTGGGGGGGGGAGLTPSDVVRIAQGWQDFADAATQVTPIEQTVTTGGSVQLTTDNNGTLTDGNTTVNSNTTMLGVNDIWNSTSNTIQFGGTGLAVNDVIDARVHFDISPNVPQTFTLVFEFFTGLDGTGTKAFELSTPIPTVAANVGSFDEVTVPMRFFIGASISNGSAVVSLKGESLFVVKMRGFNFEIRR